jgi:hypothetical protein
VKEGFPSQTLCAFFALAVKPPSLLLFIEVLKGNADTLAARFAALKKSLFGSKVSERVFVLF